MSTCTSCQKLLRRKLYRICAMAGITFLVMTQSAFAFQSAVPAPKSAVIAQLKNDMKTLVDSIETVRQQAKDNHDNIFELTIKRNAIFEKQDALGISNESFGDVLKNLQGQRIELMIDLAGMDARRESLTVIQQESEAGANPDPTTLQLLTKLLELRSKRLDEIKKLNEQGLIGPAELSDAQVELVNAQFKLALAKSSNQVSPRINEELINVSLDRAEKRARLVKTEELLKTIIESRKALLENDDVGAKIEAAQRKQEALETEALALENRLKSLDLQLRRLMRED